MKWGEARSLKPYFPPSFDSELHHVEDPNYMVADGWKVQPLWIEGNRPSGRIEIGVFVVTTHYQKLAEGFILLLPCGECSCSYPNQYSKLNIPYAHALPIYII